LFFSGRCCWYKQTEDRNQCREKGTTHTSSSWEGFYRRVERATSWLSRRRTTKTTTTWEIDEGNPPARRKERRRRRDVRAIVRYKPTQRYGLWGGYFNIFQWVSFSLCVSAAAVPLEIGCTVKPRKEKKKKKKLFFFWRNNQLDPIYMLI
jgi:hypothetical protein